MTVRVGINGFGRIGRNFYRALEAQKAEGNSTDIEVVAVNDLTDNATLAHLLKFDSILGRLPQDVSLEGDDTIVVGSNKIKALEIKDGPPRCRGAISASTWSWSRPAIFTDGSQGQGSPRGRRQEGHHLRPGQGRRPDRRARRQRRQVRRQPEHHQQRLLHHQLPCAGAKVLNDEFGIVTGLMTTIHAYTQDQNLQDGPHKDLRRARAAALNIVPTSTGAAKAIGLVMPELKGKLDGYALRVPIPTGSATDLTVELSKSASVEEINAAFKAAAEGRLKGILKYYDAPIVSSDIVTDPHCVDLRLGPDQGDRQPGQGGVLVRQRVGLLEPARRPRRTGRQVAVDMADLPNLDDLLAQGVSGRGVLVRSDLNVPLDDDGHITDQGRIVASVPTLQRVGRRRRQGRGHRPPRPPQGRTRSEVSLKPRRRRARRKARPACAIGRRRRRARRAGPSRGLDRR